MALFVNLDEQLCACGGIAFVHREALSRPVARRAQAAELPGDLAARLRLPFPDMLEKRLAAYLRALLPLAFQQPLHHHLRRDTRMVCSDDPERIFALQPRVADQYVLQCVVKSEELTSEIQSLMRTSYGDF